MNMNDLSELSMMQLGDSFFPTGLYTMSNGLETLYQKKLVTSSEQIQNLIEMYFFQQIGPADCVALACSYEFALQNKLGGIFLVDDAIHKIKLVKETRDSLVRSGRQLIKCVSSFSDDKLLQSYLKSILSARTPGTYPVSFAVCTKSLGISKRKACLMLLYGFSVSITGAALRLGILDHYESQKILNKLRPAISKTVDKYITTSFENMWQFSPEAEIIQIHHESMNSKMFIT